MYWAFILHSHCLPQLIYCYTVIFLLQIYEDEMQNNNQCPSVSRHFVICKQVVNTRSLWPETIRFFELFYMLLLFWRKILLNYGRFDTDTLLVWTISFIALFVNATAVILQYFTIIGVFVCLTTSPLPLFQHLITQIYSYSSPFSVVFRLFCIFDQCA